MAPRDIRAAVEKTYPGGASSVATYYRWMKKLEDFGLVEARTVRGAQNAPSILYESRLQSWDYSLFRKGTEARLSLIFSEPGTEDVSFVAKTHSGLTSSAQYSIAGKRFFDSLRDKLA